VGSTLLAPAHASGPPEEAAALASYSFDDDVPTGPDTFAVFRGNRGHVRLSDAFHVSGYRSLELRDVKGDGDFPELQGYFPPKHTGRLYFHFAFLTTDVREELNVALAGPGFFRLGKDGLAFWLAVRDGRLVHHSDSIARKLVPVEPFVWYAVDVAYDIEHGLYDLSVVREGWPDPVVDLRGQKNAANQPGSVVDKFSFVGDPLGDTSSVDYFVDDVVLGTSDRVLRLPFVAPGRKKFFVDAFLEYERRLLERPRCLPAYGDEDFGPGAAAQTAAHGWAGACALLERGDAAGAAQVLTALEQATPDAGLVTLSLAIAQAERGRSNEADLALARVSAAFRDDPRYAAASAYVGLRRGDLDQAEAAVRYSASRVLDRDANPLLSLLSDGRIGTAEWHRLQGEGAQALRPLLEETLLAEQYYYVLLGKGDSRGARSYALAMRDRLARASLATTRWTERAGDAAFARRDLEEARGLYEEARGQARDEARVDLKLADVAFLSGDLERERQLRERYYGALRP
jgi:Flp pilus assembly protein TadD